MASVQTALRTLVPTSTSPADVLEQVNRLFLHNIHFTTFVTLFLGFFDPSKRRLTYSNAGHNPPLILRQVGPSADGIDWLQPTGAAIGLIEEAQFRAESVTLSPGDIVLLYTDGITEAVNAQGEQFGEERLAALVRRAGSSSPMDLVGALRGTLEEFTHGRPLADDTTVIACRVAG
jgi:sigma-B regulation protein RsbU (phosphoserine phosphatase)